MVAGAGLSCAGSIPWQHQGTCRCVGVVSRYQHVLCCSLSPHGCCCCCHTQVSLPTQYNNRNQDPVGALSSALARLQANRPLRELREVAKGITKQLPQPIQVRLCGHVHVGGGPGRGTLCLQCGQAAHTSSQCMRHGLQRCLNTCCPVCSSPVLSCPGCPAQVATSKIDEYARGMISGSGSTLFEELGLYYIGPVDGHSVDDLVAGEVVVD